MAHVTIKLVGGHGYFSSIFERARPGNRHLWVKIFLYFLDPTKHMPEITRN